MQNLLLSIGSQIVKGSKPYRGQPAPPSGCKALTFELNDVIEVLDKEDVTWWKGRSLRTCASGYFPSRFVVGTHIQNYIPFPFICNCVPSKRPYKCISLRICSAFMRQGKSCFL